jgi:hypothetical protein
MGNGAVCFWYLCWSMETVGRFSQMALKEEPQANHLTVSFTLLTSYEIRLRLCCGRIGLRIAVFPKGFS